jgi:hypothetical protein
MGLRQILGKASGGGLATWDFVSAYLRTNYIDNPQEKERRRLAAVRDKLYANKGNEELQHLVEIAFTNDKNRELREVLIPWAKWKNLTKRVVRLLATVYQQPAKRSVQGTTNQKYQDFLRAAKKNTAMRELDRRLVLHEDVWIQYRVQKAPTGPRPIFDVISPAMFWAIAHPHDPTLLIGIILDQTPTHANKRDTDPHYRVWTDDETFLMDAAGRIFGTSVESWPIGRMPGVLASTCPPSLKAERRLLASEPFADVVAGHQAQWFQRLLGLKESKSATKQLYHSGDMSNAVAGQAPDTETDVFTPEGTNTQAIDRGMDLSQFSDMAKTIDDDVAEGNDIPPSVMHHTSATSGAEVMLRMIPLRGAREERIDLLRDVERELVQVEASINRAENLVQYVFDATSWSMNFGEVQVPETAAERNSNFETERRLLLRDTIEEIMERDPDLTEEQASELLAKRVNNETERVKLSKDLMALNGSVESKPGEKTPQQNGADGRAAAEAPAEN